jgi:hypothetical protein
MASHRVLGQTPAAMRSVPLLPGLPLVALVALLGCSRASGPDEGAPSQAPAPQATGEQNPGSVSRASNTPVQPLQKTKFGAAITESKSTPLTALVQDPSKFSDKTVRTEGMVTAVCQSKGCWMQLSDETGVAHVKFAGYGFFVPKDASGHRAVIEGKILQSEPDQCAGKDGCREKGEKESGRVAKLEFEATGVEFID